MLLVGSLVIGVSRREHHALHAEVHHLVEESAYAFGIGAVEQSRIRGHAESALYGLFHTLESLVISAFKADRQVVVLALAVEVNAEGQVFRWLEEMNLLFEQKR